MAKFNWDDYEEVPSAPSAQNSKFNWDDYEEKKQPGALEQFARNTVNDLPVIGGIVGGALGTPADVVAGPMGTVAGAGIGGYLGTATKNLINNYIDPEQAPKSVAESVAQPVIEGAKQAAYQMGGELAAPYVAKGIGALSKPLSTFFTSLGSKASDAATGATGVQSLKFADDSGKQLLDRGIVKFGYSQEQIAKKAADALKTSEEGISESLSALDAKGAGIDKSEIVSNLRARAAKVGKDPSNYGVADGINRLADRIESEAAASAKLGESPKVSLTDAENTKRGFQNSVNYNSSAYDQSLAEHAAEIYRQSVEDAATKIDPALSAKFKTAKSDYGLLRPITKAAERRAATNSQSPAGGLLDMSSMAAGLATGHPVAAVGVPIARRIIAPRIPSTIAATSDALGTALSSKVIPQAGDLAPVVTQANGSNILNAIGNKVQSINPIPQAAAQDQTPSLKGEELWAQQGIAKLGIQDQDLINKVSNSKNGKQLLIEASDLPAGSKRLLTIRNQVLQGWGK